MRELPQPAARHRPVALPAHRRLPRPRGGPPDPPARRGHAASTPSNLDGSGVTDDATLQLALLASSRVSHELLEGLSAADLRGAVSNALVAHPAGILAGVDHRHTGKIERVDTALLEALLEKDIVPVIPPVGCDGEGHSFRLNSDAVAAEVARAMQAVKVIYLTTHRGIPRLGRVAEAGEEDEVHHQLPVGEAELLHKRQGAELPRRTAHQARAGGPGRPQRRAARPHHRRPGRGGAARRGLQQRGRRHADPRQRVPGHPRRADQRDVRAIVRLIQAGVESDELVRRNKADIERQVNDFFVFEVDRSVVACAALHVYPEQNMAELACVSVDPRFENRGIGGKLMQYAEARAKTLDVETLFCLSTQAFNFFQQKGGFVAGTPDDLPPGRRERYDKSGRHSLVLLKQLA